MKFSQKLNGVFFIFLLLMSCNSESKMLHIVSDNSNTKDAHFSENTPSTNYNDFEKLQLLQYEKKGKRNNESRFAIDFNFSSLDRGIKIDSAFIVLKALRGMKNKHKGYNKFIVERIIGKWEEETINWTRQPRSDSRHFVKVNTLAEGEDIKLNVTSIVDIIVKNDLHGKGFLFRLENIESSKDTQAIIFASSENECIDSRPEIFIYYSDRD